MSAREDLRARILATSDPKPLPIENIRGWEGAHVKPLLVGQVESDPEGLDPKLRTARGLAKTLCDASGELLFDAENAEDLQALNRLSASVLNAIHKAVDKLNITTEAEAKDVGNGSQPGTASS